MYIIFFYHKLIRQYCSSKIKTIPQQRRSVVRTFSTFIGLRWKFLVTLAHDKGHKKSSNDLSIQFLFMNCLCQIFNKPWFCKLVVVQLLFFVAIPNFYHIIRDNNLILFMCLLEFWVFPFVLFFFSKIVYSLVFDR